MSLKSMPSECRYAQESLPKLVFFRPIRRALPKFVRGHLDDHERCLRQFFSLTVINEDADYDAVLDTVQPDLALFESGVYVRRDRSIRNTHRHPDVPKLGLLNADAYCLSRSVFLADMDDWGLETFFTISMVALAHTPELAGRLYVWPNFADRTVFRNYSLHRNVPILLTGGRQSHYPWRVKVDRILRERFECSSHAHGGWFDQAATEGMTSGVEYARDLAASLIVPTCGTFAHELVRKHFEIPASGALLLTERTSAVEAAGFIDGENCVFADEADVGDKVEFLLGHKVQLQRISGAGQKLVHARHSIEQRDQIRQWLNLRRRQRSNQVILQPDPFGALVLRAASQTKSEVSRTAADLKAIDKAQQQLDDNEPALAAESFRLILNAHFEPEAALGLAKSQLRLGSLDLARHILSHSVRSITEWGASAPDPVEWAWLIRVALCAGHKDEGIRLAQRYPRLAHSELDRIRSIIATLFNAQVPMSCHQRLSVHSSNISWKEWQKDLADDLSAFGHHQYANKVLAAPEPMRNVAQVTPSGIGTPRRVLPRLVRRVARRLIAPLRQRRVIPRPQPFFLLFSGEEFDAVLLIGVSDDVARRVDAAVAIDPRPLSVIRAGIANPLLLKDSVPWGPGSGVGQPLLSRLGSLGRLLIMVDESACGIFSAVDITNAVFIILGIERDLPMWVRANSWLEVRTEGLADALGTSALRVLRKSPVARHHQS